MSSSSMFDLLDFSIDRYLNPFIPHNCLSALPRPISHFLGYRAKPHKEPPSAIQWLLMVFSTVAGICLVGAVFNYAPGVAAWKPPSVVASIGASAILDYNTIRSPLAQPRNSVVGHSLAAIVGVGVAKLFMLSPEFFDQYSWIAAAVACAAASLVMSMTNTVHPPGGATALLACTEKQIIALGWRYPPLMLLASTLMLSVACLLNNTLRQYPVFWWTPEEVGSKLPSLRGREDLDLKKDFEDSDLEAAEVKKHSADLQSNSERTLTRESSHEMEFLEGLEAVHVAPYMIRLPPHMDLNDGEVEVLQGLMMRLRNHMERQ